VNLGGRVCAWAIAGLLAACAAPAPPPAPALPEVPVAWKLDAPWRPGVPRDAVPKGAWWKVFGDPALDALQARAQAASPTLALAAARLAQARALLAASSAAQAPSLGLGLRAARQRISANRPLSNYNSPNFSTVQNDFVAALAVSWEVDLSGRVQQAVAGAQAAAEQSAAELENTRLLLAADLATAYFSLRALDTELGVVTRSIQLQRRALEFVTTRHDGGVASGLDVAQQQALLDATLTQVDLLRRQRAVFEHALATLVGTAAPQFDLPAAPGLPTLPQVPLGLPSEMLERRPDVAAAERAMAVANAQVGIARAAFYPSITLAPTFGVESRALSSLFDTPSLVWSLGAQVSQVLFDGGRLKAGLAYAQAGHEAAAASYRRAVLGAMQEAEDGITGVAALGRAAAQARTAEKSARRVLELAQGRYEGGVATYLDVITAQQALLASERQATQLQGQSLLAGVFLVKALGGGW
jgi:NodT family efflux transporter outer membrane factor (OMF) lipoprotein